MIITPSIKSQGELKKTFLKALEIQNKKPLPCTFIDIKKASDKVNFNILSSLKQDLGLKYNQAIRHVYNLKNTQMI